MTPIKSIFVVFVIFFAGYEYYNYKKDMNEISERIEEFTSDGLHNADMFFLIYRHIESGEIEPAKEAALIFANTQLGRLESCKMFQQCNQKDKVRIEDGKKLREKYLGKEI